MFPQFFSFLTDMLIKEAEHIPQHVKDTIGTNYSERLKNKEFLPQFTEAALVKLISDPNFFDRDTVMHFIRNLRKNCGTYIGRIAFEATHNLKDRVDALEIREYFDRANEWERRRIIQLMSNTLPEKEYRAWQRSIKTYVNNDLFASAID